MEEGEQHVVRAGAAAVIEDGSGRVLIGRRGKYPKGIWVFPGGGIEYGERSEEALVREIREETGLVIKPTRLITVFEMIVPRINVHRIIFFYMARKVGGEVKATSDIDQIKWLTPKEIAELEDLGDTVMPILKEAGLI
ncbi:MAG: NUDIX hydrolase [Candidatus Micrarchaeota archaeon]|nr:NUDIX hydrolase [Candidatus Micrarchaeota archaeon]MDE1804506.1 NUDIX hydrolase [Candidatus Micrarchaeota archaeon]MDE1846437.1 NUDIX hydrolase [Candidatus Micrarchaeota archaeon]